MCTVTWAFNQDGYDLFFNRDEKRDRPAALPPSEHVASDTRSLYAVDPVGGGTWLGVNEHGVSVGLLNYYQMDKPFDSGTSQQSRGRLVVALLSAASATECEARLSGQVLESFSPFILFWLVDHTIRAYSWDGRALREWRRIPMPLSSSSVDTHQVLCARRKSFEQYRCMYGPVSPKWLKMYHAGHDPEKGAQSVCMHRKDAKTVSFSHIKVCTDGCTYHYVPDSPCTKQKVVLCSISR